MPDDKNEQPIKREKEQEHEDAPAPKWMRTDASETIGEIDQGQAGEPLKRSKEQYKDQPPQKQMRIDQGGLVEKAEKHASETPCEPDIPTDDGQESGEHSTAQISIDQPVPTRAAREAVFMELRNTAKEEQYDAHDKSGWPKEIHATIKWSDREATEYTFEFMRCGATRGFYKARNERWGFKCQIIALTTDKDRNEAEWTIYQGNHELRQILPRVHGYTPQFHVVPPR